MSGLGKHYKTPELAELLSINPETLRRAAARGELRPARIGPHMLWSEADVLKWLERSRGPEVESPLSKRRRAA